MSEMSLPTVQPEGMSLEDSAEVVDAIRGQKSESEWEIGYGEACAIIDNRDKAVATAQENARIANARAERAEKNAVSIYEDLEAAEADASTLDERDREARELLARAQPFTVTTYDTSLYLRIKAFLDRKTKTTPAHEL